MFSKIDNAKPDQKKIDMIRNGEVLYVITKNGEDLISYVRFIDALKYLTGIIHADKVNTYDLYIRPMDV